MTRMVSRLILIAMLLVCLVVQGCTRTPGDQATGASDRPGLTGCCTDMEDYPRWFVDVSRMVAPSLGTVLSHVVWRDGHLKSKQAAQKAILAEIRPLDIVLVSSKGRKSGQTIPGLFGHAAIHLGTQEELKALGLWSSAEVRPHAAGIEAGRTFIEADAKGVHLSPPSVVLNTDRVVILRPAFTSLVRRRQVARAYFDAIGTDFDFLFDVDTPDCTFCTELIHRIMPELKLPVQEIYGVRTILPDRVAVAALRRESGLEFVDYIKADATTWQQAPGQTLAEDIATTWSERRQPTAATTGSGTSDSR